MALSEYYRLAAENARKALKGLNMGGRDIYEMEQEADEYYANVNASLEFINKASDIITGERAEQYGDATTSFQNIADFWSVYLSRVVGSDVMITSRNVADMMILLKISRTATDFHEDSYIDIIGYAALVNVMVSPDD